MKKSIKYIIGAFLVAGVIASCSKVDDAQSTVTDVNQTAALEKVTVSYDSMSYVLGLPQGAIGSGKSFSELKTEDSAKYCNPANYTITLAANMKANNTKSDASDAKFDGMAVNTVMSTLTDSPISTSASGFTVPKGATLPVVAQGSINLLTHRLVGLYMFRQIVDGNDLATTLSPVLNYKIGSKTGAIPFPNIKTDIPTRADQQTKDFLQGLLDSKVFDK